MKLKKIFGKKQKFSFIISLLLINVILLIYGNYKSLKQRSLIDEEVKNISNENYRLTECIKENIISSEMKISLNDTLTKYPFLAWRYFEGQCSSCIIDDFEIFKDRIKNIGQDHAIIIASVKNINRFHNWLKCNEVGNLKVILCDNYQMNYFPNTKKQHFLILESPESAKMIFKPINTIPRLTTEYFDLIEKMYFDSRSINKNNSDL